MPIVSPPAIAALPTPPSTASPGDFDSKADAFLGALPTMQSQMNATASATYANAVSANDSATISQNSSNTAQASATAAMSASGAAVWVSGTTYAVGAAVYSPANMRIYRRLIAGAGTTDPSADGTNWQTVNSSTLVFIVAGTTQTAVAGTHYVLTNVGTTTVLLPASPQSADEVWITVANSLTTNIISRNTKTIMALSENMTIDRANVTVRLRYVNSTWRII